MNSKNTILLIASFFTVIAAVHSIQCYVCLYDVNRPDLPDKITNEECISKDFDGSDVSTTDDYDKCYTALAISSDGDIVSAHRGGGVAALAPFYAAISRDEDDFILKYCNQDYCNGGNGAPSMTSLGLLISGVLIFCSRQLFFL